MEFALGWSLGRGPEGWRVTSRQLMCSLKAQYPAHHLGSPAIQRRVSGSAAFVEVVQPTDLRDGHDVSEVWWLHQALVPARPWPAPRPRWGSRGSSGGSERGLPEERLACHAGRGEPSRSKTAETRGDA